MSAAPPALAVLREREFRLYVGSRFLSGTGQSLLRAAFGWHVYALTGSEFQLGLLGVVQFVPALALSLVAGALADAHDRRQIILWAQAASLASAALLWLATSDGATDLRLLYGAVVAVSAAAAFENPARQALLPSLVPREIFATAVTVHSVAMTLSFALGPALMGFVVAAWGIGAAYAAPAVLLAGSLALLVGIRARPPSGERRAVSLAVIREGLAFVRSQPVVLGAMTLDMFAVIFGGAVALLPVFATDLLGVDERGFGVLAGSFEVGSLLAALALLLRPPASSGRLLLGSVVAFALATIVFGLSRSFPLSLTAYLLAGAADQVSVVMRSTLIQLATPDSLRGRVSAVNMLFIGASNQLGAAESGFVAALTSATFSVVSGGVASLVVVALVAARVPELRRWRAS
jgi:MFS family permease